VLFGRCLLANDTLQVMDIYWTEAGNHHRHRIWASSQAAKRTVGNVLFVGKDLVSFFAEQHDCVHEPGATLWIKA
jgi:hypothetical protein